MFHMNHEMRSRIIDLWSEDSYVYFNVNIQGGPKVNFHTLGLIAPPWFTFDDCYFADGVLYLLVRGFRRQNLKIRIIRTMPSQY